MISRLFILIQKFYIFIQFAITLQIRQQIPGDEFFFSSLFFVKL